MMCHIESRPKSSLNYGSGEKFGLRVQVLTRKSWTFMYVLLILTCLGFTLWLLRWVLAALGWGGAVGPGLAVLAVLTISVLGLLVSAVGAFTRRKVFNVIAGACAIPQLFYFIAWIHGVVTGGNLPTLHMLLVQLVLGLLVSIAVLLLSWYRCRQLNVNG